MAAAVSASPVKSASPSPATGAAQPPPPPTPGSPTARTAAAAATAVAAVAEAASGSPQMRHRHPHAPSTPTSSGKWDGALPTPHSPHSLPAVATASVSASPVPPQPPHTFQSHGNFNGGSGGIATTSTGIGVVLALPPPPPGQPEASLKPPEKWGLENLTCHYDKVKPISEEILDRLIKVKGELSSNTTRIIAQSSGAVSVAYAGISVFNSPSWPIAFLASCCKIMELGQQYLNYNVTADTSKDNKQKFTKCISSLKADYDQVATTLMNDYLAEKYIHSNDWSSPIEDASSDSKQDDGNRGLAVSECKACQSARLIIHNMPAIGSKITLYLSCSPKDEENACREKDKVVQRLTILSKLIVADQEKREFDPGICDQAKAVCLEFQRAKTLATLQHHADALQRQSTALSANLKEQAKAHAAAFAEERRQHDDALRKVKEETAGLVALQKQMTTQLEAEKAARVALANTFTGGLEAEARQRAEMATAAKATTDALAQAQATQHAALGAQITAETSQREALAVQLRTSQRQYTELAEKQVHLSQLEADRHRELAATLAGEVRQREALAATVNQTATGLSALQEHQGAIDTALRAQATKCGEHAAAAQFFGTSAATASADPFRHQLTELTVRTKALEERHATLQAQVFDAVSVHASSARVVEQQLNRFSVDLNAEMARRFTILDKEQAALHAEQQRQASAVVALESRAGTAAQNIGILSDNDKRLQRKIEAVSIRIDAFPPPQVVIHQSPPATSSATATAAANGSAAASPLRSPQRNWKPPGIVKSPTGVASAVQRPNG